MHLEFGFDSRSAATLFPCGAAVARETVNFQVTSSNLVGGVWAINSVVRVSALHAESPRFKSVIAHLINKNKKSIMEKLYKLLSDAQSSLFVLFHKTWAFHWNVVGSDFTQLHQLFGGQYETMFEEIDRLSEHMRYLNVKPLSSLSRMLEVTQIQEAASSTGAKEILQELLENNEKFCELLVEISEESENQKSYATANLVQDLMESHGKFVWQLRAHLQ